MGLSFVASFAGIPRRNKWLGLFRCPKNEQDWQISTGLWKKLPEKRKNPSCPFVPGAADL
jgi:hypothetical protein